MYEISPKLSPFIRALMFSTLMSLTILSLGNENISVNAKKVECNLSDKPEYDYFIDIGDQKKKGDISFDFSIISDGDDSESDER